MSGDLPAHLSEAKRQPARLLLPKITDQFLNDLNAAVSQ
jgi:hypothetical protein